MALHDTALTTYPGFEDIAAAEVEELIGAEAATKGPGMVAFQVKNLNDLCKLCYLSQSASSVLLSGKSISPFDLGKREYEVFGGADGIGGNLAYLLLRAAGYNPAKHFLFDPFTRSGAIAIEAALFSSGFPVNYYRKDALASAFSRQQLFSKFDFSDSQVAAAKKHVKNSKSGILSSSPIMQNVRFAEKNAKIAGVNKLIRFSRLDIAWLDAKLSENSVDLVVSYPPQFRSGSGPFAAAENAKLTKVYGEFFYQAQYFLKKGGSIVFLLKGGVDKGASGASALIAAAKYKLRQKILRQFQIGSEGFELVSFTKL